MKISGIYQIQSKRKPERIYIGSAVDIHKRWNLHLRDLRKNKHHSKKLQRHYDKYREADLYFSILLGCNKKDLIKTEQYFLDSYRPYFNSSLIAGSNLGFKFSEKSKEKMRKPKSLEARRKMSEAKRGKPSLNKGKKYPNWHQTEEAKNKISNGLKGKPKSETHRLKMVEIRNNITEETRNKMRVARLGKTPWNKGLRYTILKCKQAS
ncbi:MAG TPA: hypothetical protein DDW27_21390 [Bacteroidales bacterium]|nr:hypothetical protein [Bacteroidales bacterium]